MAKIKGSSLLKKIGLALLCILVFLITLIISLPLILLPSATVVPAPLWIGLMAAGLFALSVQFWLKPAWKGMAASLAGTLIVLALAVIGSQYYAMTPPINDAQGKPVPGSIASLEKITLNGSQQWISIRGKDTTKPVLLFLAGGPGGSDLAAARLTLGGLEDHFVVVIWDQPGAGKSFDAVDRSKITVESYLTDGHELIAQLKDRVKQDKVYLVGESWGSALGILMVQRYPELFHAFAGTGQMVAFTENDQICYDFALNWAKERSDTEKVDKLVKQGPPPYYDKGIALEQATYLLDTFSYMNQNPAINKGGIPPGTTWPRRNTASTTRSPGCAGCWKRWAWCTRSCGTLTSVSKPQSWMCRCTSSSGGMTSTRRSNSWRNT